MNKDIFTSEVVWYKIHLKLPVRQQRRTAHTIHYDISYIVQGEEYGRDGAIVLLHDFPAGAFVWSDILPQLAGLNRAVYAIDMLGYGQSDHPWPADTSVWGQADCLSYMFNELQLTDMILVGHGFGGGVAQVLATRLCRDRTAALVLIDTICYLHSYAPNWPVTDMQKRQDPDAPKEVSVEDMMNNLNNTLPEGSVNPQRFNAFNSDYLAQWNSETRQRIALPANSQSHSQLHQFRRLRFEGAGQANIDHLGRKGPADAATITRNACIARYQSRAWSLFPTPDILFFLMHPATWRAR